jgi:hypothetical protein
MSCSVTRSRNVVFDGITKAQVDFSGNSRAAPYIDYHDAEMNP